MIDNLDAFSHVHVLVVGDVMLDRYWFGAVDRISPEAPVPIVLVDKQEQRAGGAANAASNVVALGAQCTLLSVVGDDQPGRTLKKLIEDTGVNAVLSVDRAAKTTEKLRILSKSQQLIRADFESPPTHEILAGCLLEFRKHVSNATVVLLSDYGKGGLVHIREMIRDAKVAGRPVIVDPKGNDFERYAGANMLTPNLKEFESVVGKAVDEQTLQMKAFKLINDLSLDLLLITRSDKGMILCTKEGACLHSPALAMEVYDVSGAGDTVISACAAAYAAGMDLEDMLKFANTAAGIVVGKIGTATVSLKEVMHSLREA